MSDRILVCPLDETLIARLHGHVLAVRVQDPNDVARARAMTESRARLHCVILDSAQPLASLPLEALTGVPLALFSPTVGDLEELFPRLPALRELRVQVYLPLSGSTTLRDARILASLGVPAALCWDAPNIDWDGLEDLLAYAAFGKLPHADIEPFSYVISSYSTRGLVDFGAVYFDEPARYLHVSREGKLAHTSADLREGRFFADGEALADLPPVDRQEDARDRTDHFFLDRDGCASCAGFRVCLGKFPGEREKSPGCGQLFSKLVDIAEGHSRKDTGGLWQP